MLKFAPIGFAITIMMGLFVLAGCSSNHAVTTVSYPIPASISLVPTPAASLELGTNTTFTASAFNADKTTITEPIIYQSSNPNVVTVASNGLACAGTWNSLTNPQICTPGSVGTAQIIATAQGVSSPATTVYVHGHIDKVTLQPAANQPNNSQIWPCLSANAQATNESNIYEAHAFSAGNDITPTVGQFNWAAINTTVVKFSNTAPGLANMVSGVSLNQTLVSGNNPGTTPIFASIGDATSVPISIVTCPVQSIQMQITSSTSTAVSMTTKTFDTAGYQLLNPPLTWSSSEPGSVSVTSAGSATGSTGTGGAATLIASCTPPTCNIGFPNAGSPFSLPIYPQNVVTLTLPNGSTGASGTVFVTSSGCAGYDGCFTALVPITYPANTLGSTQTLSSAPNSFVFNRQGTKAYVGTTLGVQSGGKGLAIVDPTTSPITATSVPSAPGKVLAVSPDGSKVIVSDTVDTPNEVYVVDVSSASPSVVAYPIAGASVAAFSPDSLKAFIISGSTLYVYSKEDHLQTLPLTAPANDVAFLTEGAFGFLAGGSSTPGINGYATCDPSASPTSIPALADPTFLQPLLGTAQILPGDSASTYHFVGLSSPNLEIISANTTPTGCVSTISGFSQAFNLGQGNFTPAQLIVSEDGNVAYIVTDPVKSPLTSVLVFNIKAQTAGAIPLTGNVNAVQAALTPDGTHIYVLVSDGTVHVLDTRLNADVQQITFSDNFCLDSAGNSEPFTCKPNLIVVRP